MVKLHSLEVSPYNQQNKTDKTLKKFESTLTNGQS